MKINFAIACASLTLGVSFNSLAAGSVTVKDLPATQETVYSIENGACRISWTAAHTKLNQHVIQQRAACDLPLSQQLPLIEQILARVQEDKETASNFKTLYLGGLNAYPEMRVRLAVLAKRSPEWDPVKGHPQSGEMEPFFVKLANQKEFLAGWQDLFQRHGLRIDVTAVEKAQVFEAGSLPYFKLLEHEGIRASDKVPSNGLTGFTVSKMSSGTQTAFALAADVCPERPGNALQYVDVFDGSPKEMASLVPDKSTETEGYWELGYVYDKGRTVTVRCKYADEKSVDVPLPKKVTRCSYTISKKVLKFTCDSAASVSLGAAYAVTLDSGVGVIDASGKLIARFPYSSIEPFSGGMASIGEYEHLGFVNAQGKLVIKPAFVAVLSFSEGLAAVQRSGQTAHEYIDVQGKTVLSAIYEEADRFQEGLAAVKKDGKWGYIDTQGRWVVPPTYNNAKPFSDGLAAVQGVFDLWGFIDKAGHVVIKPNYYDCGNFSEGLARVRQSGGFWGFINTKGDLAIPTQFFEAYDFSEGLALVENKDSRGSFVNKNGKVMIAGPFYHARSFSEGLAVAAPLEKQGPPFGFIDKTGRFVIPPHYDSADDFREGLAYVEKIIKEDDRTGLQTKDESYIRPDGKAVWRSTVHVRVGDIGGE